MKNLQLVMLVGLLFCVLAGVLADKKREGENKSIHEARKAVHRNHKEDHHESKIDAYNRRQVQAIRKHAPEVISTHKAHLQLDLNRNKKRPHGIVKDEMHLQELQIEDTRAHRNSKKPQGFNHVNHKHETNEHKDHLASSAHHATNKFDHSRIKADEHKGKVDKHKKKEQFKKKRFFGHKPMAKH